MKTAPRIMVTEDEMVVALDLERRLRRLGYDVCQIVPTGEQAVQEAAALQPDLILMDIVLEGSIDGIEATNRIQARQDVPVIYLTANADQETVRRAQLSHPASYLLKPLRDRELQIAIELALVNHTLQRQLRAAHDELEQRVAARTAELAGANRILQAEMVERRRMEEEARERATLLDKARDAIFVRNIAGTVLYWNRSAERLYGHNQAVALGQPAAELLGEDADDGAAALRATLDAGEWLGELRHRTGSGADLTVESRWTLVRDPAGRPQSILVVNTDITDRKLLEQQFLRAQRLESIGALASGIAHDLNNVFTPLLISAELLRDDAETVASRQTAELVLSSARRGAEMVKQVLLFVRGADGEHLAFRFEHLVNEVQRLLQETLPPGIRVRSTFASGVPAVRGNTTELHQVLMNLCINARDAMPSGGELTLAVAGFHADDTFARLRSEARPGDYLRVTVADTGVGMPAEVRARIFDPFFTTKETGKGTGLGLPTVKAIVDGHHGFIEVDSAPGAGTRFHVYLPASTSDAADPGAGPPALPRGRDELILVVDDEQSTRVIIKATLEAFGYRVLAADDGVEAVSLYVTHRAEIALVLTDMLMPYMDGRALVRALRKLQPALPVLAVSGSEQEPSVVKFLGEQKVGFLRKPFTREQLLLAVHEHLAVAPS